VPRFSATAVVVSVLAAAVIALLVYGVASNGDDKSIDKAVKNGERPAAPGLAKQLPVLGGPGKKSLSDYKGKVVVLNFWASWCDPCTAEAPVLQKAQRQFEKSGTGTVLGATYDDAVSDSLAFARNHKITYPSLRDVGTSLAQEYGTRALPETFVLDGRGRIVSVSRGQLNSAFLTRAIAQAEQEKS
jgi:cytochrome c biogenesis protein CcmG/thiol:disulfide interchange protein DsbE